MNDSYNALQDANRALAIDNSFAEAWLTRGLAHEQKGERNNAFKAFQQALRFDSSLQAAKAGASRTR